MKKLMIIAAVCAMASVAQAYAVNWGATNVRIPVADNPKVSQTGITTTSDSGKFAAQALTLSLFYVDSKGVEQLVTSAKNNNEGSLSSFAAINYNDAIHQAILADQDGDAVTFVMRTSYTTADGIYEFYMAKTGVDVTQLDKANKPVSFSMNSGTWNYTASAVPEPTSGLLLLLGVAGLALRRKQK